MFRTLTQIFNKVFDSGTETLKIREAWPAEYLKPVSVQSRLVPRILVTSTPLSASATYTSDVFLVAEYSEIAIRIMVSGSDGSYQVQESEDGVNNWINVQSGSISDGQNYYINLKPTANYIRIVYTNGAADQTAFRIRLALIP